MARRDVLAGITNAESGSPEREAAPGYATRGASRSMLASIGELAAKAASAAKAVEDGAVVELDPEVVDSSFVVDRMDDGEESFGELLAAIRERGQDTPILVRPHPSKQGRYMVVFGHRRLRAARELRRPIRAVVRELADQQHVVAQGQENAARDNLSFIERASFAQSLIGLGYGRETVQAALSIDAPMLTRMLSITKRIPARVVNVIGAAKGIGRDRWLELATMIDRPGNLKVIEDLVASVDTSGSASDERFALVQQALASAAKHSRRTPRKPEPKPWVPRDRSVSVTVRSTTKKAVVTLEAKNGPRFASFIAGRLDDLYEAFLMSNKVSTGD